MALGIGCALVIDVGRFGGISLNLANISFAPDFTVFWTGPRVVIGELYDTMAMTMAQTALTDGNMSPRPWVYPPSFLLWMQPFSALPFWWSYAAWNLLGLGLFFTAAWRVLGPKAWLTLLSVPVFFAILMGQTSLVVGGLLTWGVVLLHQRPRLAGALLGLAATIKPQAVVLAPLALVVGGHFVSLRWSIIVGVAVGVLTLVLYGFQPWFNWLTAAFDFLDLVRDMGILHRSVTSTGLIEAVGLASIAAGGVIAVSLILGVFLVWRAFKANDLVERLAALSLGCLLWSPYAMEYEPTALAIAATSILFDRRGHPARWLGAAFSFAVLGGWVSTAMLSAGLLFHKRDAPVASRPTATS